MYQRIAHTASHGYYYLHRLPEVTRREHTLIHFNYAADIRLAALADWAQWKVMGRPAPAERVNHTLRARR